MRFQIHQIAEWGAAPKRLLPASHAPGCSRIAAALCLYSIARVRRGAQLEWESSEAVMRQITRVLLRSYLVQQDPASVRLYAREHTPIHRAYKS